MPNSPTSTKGAKTVGPPLPDLATGGMPYSVSVALTQHLDPHLPISDSYERDELAATKSHPATLLTQ